VAAVVVAVLLAEVPPPDAVMVTCWLAESPVTVNDGVTTLFAFRINDVGLMLPAVELRVMVTAVPPVFSAKIVPEIDVSVTDPIFTPRLTAGAKEGKKGGAGVGVATKL